MLSKLLSILAALMLAASTFAQMPRIEPGVSHELAKWRAAHYGDVRYKLNLTLEKMSPVLKGTMEIRVHVWQLPRGAQFKGGLKVGEPGPEPMRPIVLDWRKIKGSESLSTISNVSVNGKAAADVRVTPLGVNPSAKITPKGVTLAYEESNEHLIFRDGVVAGENVIKLAFTSPILTSGSAITRYVDKEDGAEYIYSLFVPSDASTAFPVFDQPDLKAKFSLHLIFPPDWKAIGNMIAVAERSLHGLDDLSMRKPWGREIYFEETKPISTYVFAFAAGPFEKFADTGGNLSGSEGARGSGGDRPRGTLPTGRVSAYEPETNIYVRKSQAAKFKPHAAEVFRLNREGIEYLETYFDYKFPFSKYDLVLIPEFPFGGMEHAGATFLREDRVIFPTEPTKNDYITRANLIFHEAAHQWFGDTVTMRWFDDLWLKEGFAEFMAYKTLEKVMPESGAWKIFYERNKQAAYLTDSTKGTTPIYQEIANLNAAKSAYGNIVYRKAPSFLKQAEFYLGEKEFQMAVRAFLKKHQFANAEWTDLVKEFETASGQDLKDWANVWVKQPGLYKVKMQECEATGGFPTYVLCRVRSDDLDKNKNLKLENELMKFKVLMITQNGKRFIKDYHLFQRVELEKSVERPEKISLIFPNYQDYGYGIFLLDGKSRDYVLQNIQNEKDDFLRTMMWGSLWDSVREGELDPRAYVELVIKNLSLAGQSTTPSAAAASTPLQTGGESDESTIQTLLGRVSTAMTYYLPENRRDEMAPRLEAVLIEKMRSAPTLGQRITFYRAFLNIASTEKARAVLKQMLANTGGNLSGSEGAPGLGGDRPKGTLPTGRVSASDAEIPLKTKDKFDMVTKLLILGDPEAPKLLADLEKTETSDEAKRNAYAARAGIATAENKTKFWSDFTTNKELSESWIEAAFGPFNSVRHADLTLPYLERALNELPNHKRSRKIFFVNGWLAASIGGQKSEQALAIVNKFLADNPNLDKDLRLKILENVDLIERAVKIRTKFNSK